MSKRRIPRRRTDWVEDSTAWLMVSLALVCAVLSVIVGMHVHASLLDRATQEAATRTPVQALLLGDATPLASSVDQGSTLMAQVPVRYTDTDGVVRDGLASVDGTPHAGDTVTIWLDRAHHIVPKPTDATDAGAAGCVAGGIVLFVSLAMLTVAWYGVRHVVLLRNCAQWEREWAIVEPLWSGRTSYGNRS